MQCPGHRSHIDKVRCLLYICCRNNSGPISGSLDIYAPRNPPDLCIYVCQRQIYRFGILGALHIAQCARHISKTEKERQNARQNIEYIGMNRYRLYMPLRYVWAYVCNAKGNVGDFSARGHLWGGGFGEKPKQTKCEQHTGGNVSIHLSTNRE